MDRLKKMFGEPAALVGLIQLILASLLTFNTGLTHEWVAAIMGVVYAGAAVYTMFITKTVALSAIVEALKATVTLIAGFGVVLTDAQFASIVGGVAFVVGLYQRTQTGVAVNPGFHDEPVTTPVVVPGEVISNVPTPAAPAPTGDGTLPATGIVRRGMPSP